MKEADELTLRSFMKANAIHIQQFFSIALQVVKMLGERTPNEDGLIRITPEKLSVRFEDGQLALQRARQQMSSSNDELAYISPEHTGRIKQKVDLRSDLYIAGVLFYELLTGGLPIKADSASDWIYAHMAVLPVPPRTVNPDIPQMLNDLVMKLLSKSVEDRYQSVNGLLYDLNRCSCQWIEKGTIDSFQLGEVDERGRFRLPNRLYGRDLERQQLIDAYERSCLGSKELFLIGGHAGSGKSMLIQALQSHVMQAKGIVAIGKYELHQESRPYAAFIAAVSGLIRQILADGEEQVARWRTKLLKAVGQSGSVLTPLIPELTWMIGEQRPVEPLSPMEATNRFRMLFGNLIKAFADELHPLVIVLEDLQWADSASVELLRDLWNHASLKHVLIIGVYRDDELNARHSLRTLFLEPTGSLETGSHFMNIRVIGHSDVARYVADMLHADVSEVKPLVDVLYRQTAGSPFFFTQMLQTYYDQGLLFFNSDQLRWAWNLEGIGQLEGFHDVIDLIMARFEMLPEGTRQILGLAGCLGSSFELRMLSALYGKSNMHTEQDLLPAVSEGLIVAEENGYRFLHDQVQEAACDLLPIDEKKRIHLEIGRSMLLTLHLDNARVCLFELVHHLNAGSEYMTDPEEVDRLAHLNLQAGKRAKASAAYSQALELLNRGERLLEGEGWSRQDALYFNLLLESSECQYYCGYFEQAEAVLDQLLLHADNPADRAKIYVIQIAMYAFRKREDKACHIALNSMAEFGMHIPSRSSGLSILAEIAKTQLQLSKRGLLEDLPITRNPKQQALADIVMASSSILFIANEELSVIVFAKYVRMSLKHGNSEAFTIALGSYAIALCFGLKLYKPALRLAEAAIYHAEKTDSVLLKGKMNCILGLMLQFLRPQQSDGYFQKAGQLSLEGGDMVYAGYAISSQLITGSEDLWHLNRLCRVYEEKTIPALDVMTQSVLHLIRQYVHLLQSAADSAMTFNNELLDGDELLREEIVNNTYKSHLYMYYTCKLEVHYIYANYSEAAALAEASVKFETTSILSFNQRHCFYHALAIMAEYPGASDSVKSSYRKAIPKLLARMKVWTKVVPASTLSKYKLMLAEWARVNHDHAKAAKLYDEAIHWAQESGYPRDEAIAAELAATFHLALNNDRLAEAYLRNACAAYFKWGATGKVYSLQKRYPALAALSFHEWDEAEAPVRSTELDRQQEIGNFHAELGRELDMEILRQASKIQSGDLTEMDLLEIFLQLAIRNTGAERGLVLLGNQGKLAIKARQEINREGKASMDSRSDYAVSVVQFVIKTRESVILGEARDSLFATDPHIQEKRSRSVLCLPVRYLDNQDGVLYLENNMISDAFTAERLEVLEMIFSRMVYLRLWQLEKHRNSVTPADQSGETLGELLTSRELEIVRLMAEGLSNKQIALHLDITEGTVKSHANNIYGKLQVNKRVQAIKKARELQLLK